MTTAIRSSFDRVGINETEQRILIYLIENGRSKASAISKDLTIKRPTVYSALSTLAELGLVLKESIEGLHEYEAASKASIPGLLDRLARKRFDESKRSTQVIAEYLSTISSGKRSTENKPVIVTLDTLANFDRAVLSVLLNENFCAVWDPSTAFFRDSWKADTEAFLEVTGKMKTNIREIIFECDEANWYKERICNPNHKLLILGRQELLLADVVIGETSVIFSFNDPSSDSGVQIFHEGLRKLQLSLFDLIWTR